MPLPEMDKNDLLKLATDPKYIPGIYNFGVKLRRAIESARNEKEEADDGFPKDSDGSAKVALIGLDRSIAAWKMMLSYFPGQQQPILNIVASLESIRRRVEAQFPQARAFMRPGLDDV